MKVLLTSSEAQTLLDWLNSEIRKLHDKLNKLRTTHGSACAKSKTYEKLRHLSEIKRKLIV